jgi:hypothetical protein
MMTKSRTFFTRFIEGKPKPPNLPNHIPGLHLREIRYASTNRKQGSEGSEGSVTALSNPRGWLGTGLLNTTREVQA